MLMTDTALAHISCPVVCTTSAAIREQDHGAGARSVRRFRSTMPQSRHSRPRCDRSSPGRDRLRVAALLSACGGSMTTVCRRAFLGLTAAAAVMADSAKVEAARARAAGLSSITTGVQPISAQEHSARVAKVQTAMQQRRIAALLVEAGSTLEYFTGIHWWRSERTTAALIPAEGQVVVVTPFFEEPSIRETLKITADVRPWKEDESPFDLIAGALRDHAAIDGPLAVEATTRFFIVEHAVKASGTRREVVLGDELVRACRMVKSSAELALMQAANDVTIAALRHVHGRIVAGMRRSDILSLLIAATEQLGGSHEFSLVLLNEASAYPHGSVKPQEGS